MRSLSAHLFILAGFTLLSLILFGCKDNGPAASQQITGSGRMVTQTRTPGIFSGIQVTGIAKVIITQDSVQSLRIEADDNIMDRVTTSVNNGVLAVGLVQGSYNNVTIIVHATMTVIRSLECIGSAEFLSNGQVQSDSIVCRIVGAGRITLTGTATSETVQITGAGDVHNFGLNSVRCSALISGTGNIEVNVSQQLDATIAGTGQITYGGNPPVVHQTVTGVGSVRPRP